MGEGRQEKGKGNCGGGNMTFKDEIEQIMRRNGLRHVSASILDDGTFRVSTYRREYTSYYMRHLEERR